MNPVAATLAIGILIGYLGQRSRFCGVGGFRDYFLSRDTYLLKGYLGLLVGAAIGFAVFKLMGGAVYNFPLGVDLGTTTFLVMMAVGGVGMGFFSVLAGGDPFRQHVLAAEGRASALFYLAGFYIGIVYFFLVTFEILELITALTTG